MSLCRSRWLAWNAARRSDSENAASGTVRSYYSFAARSGQAAGRWGGMDHPRRSGMNSFGRDRRMQAARLAALARPLATSRPLESLLPWKLRYPSSSPGWPIAARSRTGPYRLPRSSSDQVTGRGRRVMRLGQNGCRRASDGSFEPSCRTALAIRSGPNRARDKPLVA
jgi:hypothetical protein